MQNPQNSSQCLSSRTLTVKATREDIRDDFLRTYEADEELFRLLASDSTFYESPEPKRLPLIFYYGHTACFYINKLHLKGIISERLNPQVEEMFATGVNENDWDDLDQTHYNWPTMDEVRQYRAKAKEIILNVIDTVDVKISWDSEMWAVLMGTEHERIHLETSAVIIRRVPVEKIKPSNILRDCPIYTTDRNKIPKNNFATVPAFHKTWDRQRDNTNSYGWDNEFGQKQINTKQFLASTMLVSNGEYLQFVEDQGYSKLEYWCKNGLKWLQEDKQNKPLFWQDGPNGYQLKTLNKLMDLPLDWPVEVTLVEAKAFCKWKSEKTGLNIKVPTQEEMYAMRELIKTDETSDKYREIGNFDLEKWASPCPVNMFKVGQFYDIVGNVHRHTTTPLYPFDKFVYHDLYEDYSTPSFNGKQILQKGGSFITNVNSAHNARNGFRDNFNQFTGIRMVISENEEKIAEKREESDELVELAIQLNFCREDSYILKAVERVKENLSKLGGTSLVVGCSVGKLMFEMSKIFDLSEGQDFTSRFFQIASRMMDVGSLTYKGKKISIEEDNYDISKNKLIRMNPVNIHTGKLSKYRFIIFDGFALREDNMKRAIPNFLPFLQGESYVAIINTQNWNWVQQEEVKKMSSSLQRVQYLQMGKVEERRINYSLYKYK